MKYIYQVVLILTIIFCSCQKKNRYIIPEDKFVDILVDIHIADAFYSNNQYGELKLSKIDSSVYYKAIFEKYNIEKAKFDSTLKTYTMQPIVMESIYDKVIDKLKKIEAERLKQEKNNSEGEAK